MKEENRDGNKRDDGAAFAVEGVDLPLVSRLVSDMIAAHALAVSDAENRERKASKEYRQLLLLLIETADMMDKYFRESDMKKDQLGAQTHKWINYFRGIRRKIDRELTALGVAVIETPDGKAVPGFHTIIDTRELDGVEPGMIVEERKRGYLFDKAVLRKAEVITAG